MLTLLSKWLENVFSMGRMKERLQIAPLSYTQGRGETVFFKHGGNGKEKEEWDWSSGGLRRSFKGPRQKYRPTYIRTTAPWRLLLPPPLPTPSVSHAFSSAPDSCYYPRILVGISTIARLQSIIVVKLVMKLLSDWIIQTFDTSSWARIHIFYIQLFLGSWMAISATIFIKSRKKFVSRE